MKKKDYYSTAELSREPWFPIRSAIKISKLVEEGELKAVNISTKEKKRYKINKQSARDFAEKIQNKII